MSCCLFCVCLPKAGPGSFLAGVQEEPKTDLNEVKGLLEIALLEKHFLSEYIMHFTEPYKSIHILSFKQQGILLGFFDTIM